MCCYGFVDNMIKYFCKYIIKFVDFSMKHRYYVGGDVIRVVLIDYVDFDFDFVFCDVIFMDFGEFKYIAFKFVVDFFDFLLCFMTQYEINYNFLKGG